MADVLVVRVASMVGPAGPPGSGTILEGDGILATEVGADVEVAVDFGAGIGKALEATQDAIEAALAVALTLDGPVVALDGELVSRPLVAADLAPGGSDNFVLVKSGTGQAWSAVGSAGDTVEQGTGILITGTEPKNIAADFGSGANKVLQATKASVEAVVALGSGLVKSTANVLGLATKSDLESLLALGSGLVKSTANALGLATKSDVEALLAAGTGIVRASSNVLSASTLTKDDLDTGGTTGQTLRLDTTTGTVMEWFTPTDISNAGVVTGLSSASVIPVTTGLSYGTNLPTTAFHRLGHNNVWLTGRNSTNAGDFNLITWGAVANTLALGSTTVNMAFSVAAGSAGSFSLSTSGSSLAGATAHSASIGGVVKFGLSSTGVALGTTTSNANNILWSIGSTAPTLSQTAKGTDAAPVGMEIAPQAPFASATGANRVPGGLTVTLAAPTNSGTTHAAFTVAVAAANVLVVDKDSSGNGRIAVTVQSASSATAGGASALPATPTGYKYETINGVVSKIPYYTV